ncbi:MAG: SPFH domain-containing protein [Flavobacteriales bacterium]|nr:SPFH domain-containing protein [Flavobacteriales bacterium]MCB9204689.1 SPFH domain-containing protein [Flavobacteriales bacterium]
MKEEKTIKPISGWIMLMVHLVMLAAIGYIAYSLHQPAWLLLGFIPFITMIGFMIVNPNQSTVLVLFGKYQGTVKSDGFFWVNPFNMKKRISLRAHNFDNEPIKVNDKLGNPIMIGAVVVWRVKDTYKAAFDVNDYLEFVQIQSEAALRRMAGHYPYDEFHDEGEEGEISLRSGGKEVNDELEQALDRRLGIAGIEVLEARISHLAYANEIAGAMLQRQQATAIVAARRKIVEGAVGMVEMALEELSQKDIVHLDDEKKAQMVSNLMVVLCSDKAASPIVNAGSLY